MKNGCARFGVLPCDNSQQGSALRFPRSGIDDNRCLASTFVNCPRMPTNRKPSSRVSLQCPWSICITATASQLPYVGCVLN